MNWDHVVNFPRTFHVVRLEGVNSDSVVAIMSESAISAACLSGGKEIGSVRRSKSRMASATRSETGRSLRPAGALNRNPDTGWIG